jgi:hypothetical protein
MVEARKPMRESLVPYFGMPRVGYLMRVKDAKSGVIQGELSHEGRGRQEWGNSMRVANGDTSSQEECL